MTMADEEAWRCPENDQRARGEDYDAEPLQWRQAAQCGLIDFKILLQLLNRVVLPSDTVKPHHAELMPFRLNRAEFDGIVVAELRSTARTGIGRRSAERF